MKKTLKLSLILSVLFLCASAFGQTLLNTTTLSQAIYKGARTTTFAVGSTTNIHVSDDLYIDTELFNVVAVGATGTTVQTVHAYGGTMGAYHNSGALVFIIPAAAQPYALVAGDGNASPSGACTRGGTALTGGLPTTQSTLYLPIIDTRTGELFDCLGGVFVGSATPNGLTPFGYPFTQQAPVIGSVAYTGVGAATTTASTTMYCMELDIAVPKQLTGLQVLNGGTVGTDKHLVALYDSTGILLANSAVAGATTSGANTFQKYAFTTPYVAIAPAMYFGCVQANGTTDNIRMAATGTNDTFLTKGVTGQTFGTLANFTAPTTFTTAVGPYLAIY